MLLFKKVMDNIVDFYKNNCKNKNTTKATNSWLRTYKHIGIVEFYIVLLLLSFILVLLLLIVEFYIGIVIVEFYIGIVIVEFYIGIVIVEFYIGIVIVEFYIGIVIVEFYIGIVIVEFYIGIVIVEFYIGIVIVEFYIVIVEFLDHYYFFIAYSTDVSYYMLGSSSCNSKRNKYINTWIRVQYRFISLVFLFSELFGTRAYALVQITQKIKNSKNKSYIARESMR